MPSFQKYFKKHKPLLIGLGLVGGGAFYYFNYRDSGKVSASWTTNFIPSKYAKWDDNWDQLSITNEVQDTKKINKILSNMKPQATRHLILIRHGHYDVDGKRDEERKLTQMGRRQAEFTAKRLRELNFPYTQLIKSTMTRAQETGSIISKALPNVPVKECNFIREGAPIPPEPPVGHWKAELHFYQDGARIEAAFRQYFHRAPPEQTEDSYELYVCHANVIRYFVCRALQFPPEAWLRFSLNHASITWISITPSGRVILRTLGDSGHIPPDLLSLA